MQNRALEREAIVGGSKGGVKAAISIQVSVARRFLARARGLLGRPAPLPGQGLWLEPCGQVHTLGMRYPIDVVTLAATGEVLAIETLAPWRVGRRIAGAASVVELAAGEAARLGLVVGEKPCLLVA